MPPPGRLRLRQLWQHERRRPGLKLKRLRIAALAAPSTALSQARRCSSALSTFQPERGLAEAFGRPDNPVTRSCDDHRGTALPGVQSLWAGDMASASREGQERATMPGNKEVAEELRRRILGGASRTRATNPRATRMLTGLSFPRRSSGTFSEKPSSTESTARPQDKGRRL